jgi:DNA-binding LytR/AlgR family response regulator
MMQKRNSVILGGWSANRKSFERATRAKHRIAGKLNQNNVHRIILSLERLTAVHTYSDRLAIPENGRVQFVATKDIDWIEAEANYVRFHVGNRTSLHDREHPPYQ